MWYVFQVLVVIYFVQACTVLLIFILDEGEFKSKREFLNHLIPFYFIPYFGIKFIKHVINVYNSLE